jgi:hypothetical protein
MIEKPYFGRKIELVGKGQINIVSGDTTITIKETVAPRFKKTAEIPEGSLTSLRPLLRGVMGSDLENDTGYWLQIDKMATMDPQKAANKLKRAGLGHLEVAELLVRTDSLVSQNLAWGNISPNQLNAKITEVAEVISYLFQSVRPTIKRR